MLYLMKSRDTASTVITDGRNGINYNKPFVRMNEKTRRVIYLREGRSGRSKWRSGSAYFFSTAGESGDIS